MVGTTGEVVEALRRAMLPALPKLDMALLQKALTAAKEDGGVDQKLIRSAEGKLSQAQKRAAMPSGQQIEERDVALEELKAAARKILPSAGRQRLAVISIINAASDQ